MTRIRDFVIASVLLVLLSPLLLVCALAVRCSSAGRVFFVQRRLGLAGRPFGLVKFRSMYEGVPDIRNSDGSAYTADSDARVTAVGRFLRRTSLDELPQLFNVLCGHMSLVGPRPDQVDQIRFYTEAEQRKLLVKPGLTGLAQINGRNEIPWERRKALDLQYVESRSQALDLYILAKTIPYVLLQRNINTHDNNSKAHTPDSY